MKNQSTIVLALVVTLNILLPLPAYSALTVQTPIEATGNLALPAVRAAQSAGSGKVVSSSLIGDFLNLFVILRANSKTSEFGFIINPTLSRYETQQLISYGAGDQLELQYRGEYRVGVFEGISVAGTELSWEKVLLGSTQYPEFDGYSFLTVSANCKVQLSFSFSNVAITSSSLSLIEVNIVPQISLIADPARKIAAIGERAVILQQLTSAQQIVVKPYGGDTIVGWKDPALSAPTAQTQYSLPQTFRLITTQSVGSGGAQYCGCGYHSKQYLDNLDSCVDLQCPFGDQPVLSPDSDFAAFCVCSSGRVWNRYSRECDYLIAGSALPRKPMTMEDCQADVLSTGELLESGECQCTAYSYWDPKSFECLPYCYMDPFSTGVKNGDKACFCKESFEWSVEHAQCYINCLEVSMSTGQPRGSQTCECKGLATWDFRTLTCQGDCVTIAFATGELDLKGGCICEDKFEWSPSKRICQIDCTKMSSFSTGSRVAINQCGCVSGSLWSSDALDCLRNCSMYEHATGLNLNPEQCVCEDGFHWENTPLRCRMDCGNMQGQLSSYNEENGYCNCEEPTYFFSYQLQICSLNCSSKAHTRYTNNPTTFSCNCVLGYSWIASAAECQIQCNGHFDVAISNPTTCQCRTNALFDNFSNSCLVNCRLDELSTKSFTGTACVCKANAFWNQNSNKCECTSGYTMNPTLKVCETSTSGSQVVLVGVIVGVISSAGGALLSKMYFQRKVLKEEDGVESKQSNEGMKSEEMVD